MNPLSYFHLTTHLTNLSLPTPLTYAGCPNLLLSNPASISTIVPLVGTGFNPRYLWVMKTAIGTFFRCLHYYLSLPIATNQHKQPIFHHPLLYSPTAHWSFTFSIARAFNNNCWKMDAGYHTMTFWVYLLFPPRSEDTSRSTIVVIGSRGYLSSTGKCKPAAIYWLAGIGTYDTETAYGYLLDTVARELVVSRPSRPMGLHTYWK